MGRSHVSSLNTKAKLLAVCDVDELHLQEGMRLGGADVKGTKISRDSPAKGHRYHPYCHSAPLACAHFGRSRRRREGYLVREAHDADDQRG